MSLTSAVISDATIYVYTESAIIPCLKNTFSSLKYLKVNTLKGESFHIYVSIHFACEFTYKLLDNLIFGLRIIYRYSLFL